MKRTYERPVVEVYEVSIEGIIANSIPNGGEIPIGGGGHPDAARYRGDDWEEYER